MAPLHVEEHDIAVLDGAVEHSTAPSGCTVLSDSMLGTHSVALGCWVGVGSRDESESTAGSSHFLEHLLFKGTTRRTALEVNRAVDAVGGEFNAYTTREATVFYLRVPKPHRQMAIDLLAEVVVTPKLSPEDLEIERNVILEEFEAALDTPDDLVFMNLAEGLFPDHPVGREVLGRIETIEGLTAEEISAFHSSWYRPNRFVIAAAGAVEHDWLVQEADKFGDGLAPGLSREQPQNPDALCVTAARPIEQVHCAWGWRSPESGHADRFAQSVLNHVLGGGPTSRLYTEIREQRGLAYAVQTSHSSHSDCGSFALYLATAPRHLSTVRTVLEDVLGDLCASGVTEEELTVAKGYLAGSMLMGLEDSDARMSRLGAAFTGVGRVTPVGEVLTGLAEVTAADIQRVATTLFTSRRVESLVGPASAVAPFGSI